MDIATLVLAYAAAALVALTVTAAFSTPIEEVLFRLLPEEVAPAWQQFVKFALFVATFGGGMPGPLKGAMIDSGAPAGPPAVPGESFMLVMSSFSGALMAAAWALLVFFAVTLAFLTARRVYTLLRRRRELLARRAADREEEREREKALQDSGGSGGEPLKRREPPVSRPVKQERPPAQHPRRW